MTASATTSPVSSHPTPFDADTPSIPWQARPAECPAPVWRYHDNPIIHREALPGYSWGIFNSAAVPFGDRFAGVFRVDNHRHRFNLHVGFSGDGIDWDINRAPLELTHDNPDFEPFVSGYDPRVVWVEDRYYVTWCNRFHGPTIGQAWTRDFQTFHQLENAFLPNNRNGVLFPRKIDGRFAMLSRPSDQGHTPFGEMFYSESPDLEFWGRHRFVMGKRRGWGSLKIGPGPAPIETDAGWLVFYHGVWASCSGYVYSMGAALLDLEKPWKVVCRPGPYILAPMEMYETTGGVPNVIFPCAALHEPSTDRLAIYYGAADSHVALAFADLEPLLEWMHEHHAEDDR